MPHVEYFIQSVDRHSPILCSHASDARLMQNHAPHRAILSIHVTGNIPFDPRHGSTKGQGIGRGGRHPLPKLPVLLIQARQRVSGGESRSRRVIPSFDAIFFVRSFPGRRRRRWHMLLFPLLLMGLTGRRLDRRVRGFLLFLRAQDRGPESLLKGFESVQKGSHGLGGGISLFDGDVHGFDPLSEVGLLRIFLRGDQRVDVFGVLPYHPHHQ
mmetsp:Transcript_17828/g.44208  ORF Transcript_17828/g.44208 Transcript_17828/m.44208 type:complete len:212 (+) Transcript_17828:236-871(+)